jgi:hypothetical protein
MRPFEALRSAFAYAEFADADVESTARKLIDELDTDLTRADYNEGETVEHATEKLTQALNDADALDESLDDDDVDDDDVDVVVP